MGALLSNWLGPLYYGSLVSGEDGWGYLFVDHVRQDQSLAGATLHDPISNTTIPIWGSMDDVTGAISFTHELAVGLAPVTGEPVTFYRTYTGFIWGTAFALPELMGGTYEDWYYGAAPFGQPLPQWPVAMGGWLADATFVLWGP